MGARHGAGGERVQQILGQFGKIGDVDAAVAAVGFPELLGFEVLSEGGGDHFAGEQLLDELRRSGRSAGRGGGGGAFAYLRSTRAMRWRRAASCSWMSSMLRFFFA